MPVTTRCLAKREEPPRRRPKKYPEKMTIHTKAISFEQSPSNSAATDPAAQATRRTGRAVASARSPHSQAVRQHIIARLSALPET